MSQGHSARYRAGIYSMSFITVAEPLASWLIPPPVFVNWTNWPVITLFDPLKLKPVM